ncbi:unnamed protein product [Amoebophrya sp. A25]|nr:unnamed protein product [Amoebophrya sp. A25]|eukprot:GSA25T00010500001.1
MDVDYGQDFIEEEEDALAQTPRENNPFQLSAEMLRNIVTPQDVAIYNEQHTDGCWSTDEEELQAAGANEADLPPGVGNQRLLTLGGAGAGIENPPGVAGFGPQRGHDHEQRVNHLLRVHLQPGHEEDAFLGLGGSSLSGSSYLEDLDGRTTHRETASSLLSDQDDGGRGCAVSEAADESLRGDASASCVEESEVPEDDYEDGLAQQPIVSPSKKRSSKGRRSGDKSSRRKIKVSTSRSQVFSDNSVVQGDARQHQGLLSPPVAKAMAGRFRNPQISGGLLSSLELDLASPRSGRSTRGSSRRNNKESRGSVSRQSVDSFTEMFPLDYSRPTTTILEEHEENFHDLTASMLQSNLTEGDGLPSLTLPGRDKKTRRKEKRSINASPVSTARSHHSKNLFGF